MAASPKKKLTNAECSIGRLRVLEAAAAGRTSAARQSVSYRPDDRTPVDWRNEQQVQAKVGAWAASEQDKFLLTDYVESNTLKWIEELEQIAYIALLPQRGRGPDYDLAARILLSLIKLSSVNRQRVDLTAQIAMSSGPDLSGLSDAELRAIELADNEKLNELALRIGRVKLKKPS